MMPETQESAVVAPKGVRFDVPREEYDRIARTNWSRLKHILRSPAHYRHALLQQHHGTEAMKVGRAAHLAVLEPDLYQQQVAIWDGGIRRGKDWDGFRRKHEGREILKLDQHELCLALSAAVRANPDAARYLSAGKSEVTVQWQATAPEMGGLPGYNIPCKARLDYVNPTLAHVDLKTCRDASPTGFGLAAARMRYHVQAAFYSDGYEAATGVRLPYVLIAVETEPPHVVAVYRVLDEQIDVGREVYRDCLSRLAFCTRENTWDGYATGEQSLVLPQWAVPHDDEDVTELGLEFTAEGETA